MSTSTARPWLRFYGRVPESLDYPEVTLYEARRATAARVPEAIAWDFFDTTVDLPRAPRGDRPLRRRARGAGPEGAATAC